MQTGIAPLMTLVAPVQALRVQHAHKRLRHRVVPMACDCQRWMLLLLGLQLPVSVFCVLQ